MSFRRWVETLRANGKLTEAKKPLSSRLGRSLHQSKNFEKAKFPEVEWRKFT